MPMVIDEFTFYEIVWYFLIYSFLGWGLEVIYAGVTTGEVVNRGFLNGPVCPIYGFGMVGVFLLFDLLFPGGAKAAHGAVLFALGLLLATVIELFGGWALDKLFHTRWWDYSDKPFNLHGYVCPEFSLYWGLIIVFVVRILHPFIAKHTVDVLPEDVGWPLAVILYMVYAADLVVTVMVVNGLNKGLDELDAVRASMRVVSDDLSDVLGGSSIKTAQLVEEDRVKAELAKKELGSRIENSAEEIRKKEQLLYEKLLKNKVFGPRRLLNAFPDMKIPDHTDLLEDIRAKIKDLK